MDSTPPSNLPAAAFYTTRWTRVCMAKADSEEGRRALADLCDAYYEPVVAYLRSVFRDADAARDVGYGRPLAVEVPADPSAVLHGDRLLALYRPAPGGSVPVAVLAQ